MAPEAAIKILKNISNSWMNAYSICIDKLKRCILKQPTFSPKLDMQSYPVTLKTANVPQNIYISILMMYLCKFGPNISTRCLDEMQINFFLSRVGYFGIVLVGEKSRLMNLQVYMYQSFKHIQFYLKYQKRFIVNNNSVVIWL